MRFNQFRGGPSFGFQFFMTPAVKGLLIANAAVFVAAMFPLLKNLVAQHLALTPTEAIGGLQIWQLGTYMFVHFDFWHLVLNMLPLWMFGSNLERVWGRRTFLTYYFLSGIGGSIAYLLINWGSGTMVVGASGAVCGVLMAFGILFPNQVIYLFGLLPIKAKWFVTGYVVFTLLAVLQQGGGNIAHSAHLGGMLFGYIYLKGFTLPNLGAGGLAQQGRRWRMKRKMRVVPPRNSSGDSKGGNGGFKPRHDNRGDNEIDRILDKITSEGLDSLTEAEQEALRRAGRHRN